MGKKAKAKPKKSKLRTVAKAAMGVAAAGVVGTAIAKGVSVLRSGAKGRGGRRRRKSAGWYAKELVRLKLKKRYEKVKYGA